jgi:branched-chain amino acid transport system ATP-binding protein
MSALAIRNLEKSFGALRVIHDLNIEVASGARHAVIGPNGAGKTTLFNLITGWLRPDSGAIEFDGADLGRLDQQAITHKGVARSWQRNTLFNALTVLENVRLAVQATDRSRYRMLRDRLSFADVIGRARAVAARMGLEACVDLHVSELSYGQKRQLEVAMALASEPRLLLLDEPAAGTSPAERATLIRLIGELPHEVTLLLVEHDMDVVFEVCERITVLSYGRLLATGTPDEVRNDKDVRDAYLGRRHQH